jgi:hypothetical protein
MADTVETLVGRVMQRVGQLPGYDLVLDWLDSALQDELAPYSEWSWLRRNGLFLFNAYYATGTITIARGADYGDTSGSVLTQEMVGRQLRAGGNTNPIVTITRISGSRIEFSPPWGAAALSGATFEIYNAFLPVPSDFKSFLVVADLTRGYQIDWWSKTINDFDREDAQRSHGGDQAWYCTLRDYTEASLGVVGTLVRAAGSGNLPVSGGQYTGVSDAIFVVEMTSSTVFRWKKDNGSWTSGTTIDSEGIAQELSEGVTISFPSSVLYTSGDVFSIQVVAAPAPGTPRYEFWPHIKAAEVRPYIYNARPRSLKEPNAVIPPMVNSGYLLEKALAACARWKNPENKYYDLKLAMVHDGRADALLVRMEREDQARLLTDVQYDSWRQLPTVDSGYLQGHDLGYEFDTLD